jgi:type II secretory pathway component PulC
MKTKLILFLLMLAMITIGYPQDDYKNPFESGLPQEVVEQDIEPVRNFDTDTINLPEGIIIQGVLWGNDKPQAIINGEIYKKGESLKENQRVSLFDIEKNIVLLSYQGKIFKKKPTKSNFEQRRQ